MSIQIDLGIDKKDLPDFCYSLHVNNISNYLMNKIYSIEPVDVKVFLSKFIEILGTKINLGSDSYEDISNELMKRVGKFKGNIYSAYRNEDRISYFMFIADEVIYYIDFKRGIVTVNLQNKLITTEQELSDLINLYSQCYNIKVEIIEEMEGWWYLKASIQFKKLKSMNPIKESSEKFQEFSDYVYYSIDGNILNFVLDVKTPLNQNWKDKKLSAIKIKKIFEILNDLFKKIS
ncbi:MAG: hypothetical protein ACFFD2_06845 [Promethearchaeota archaeon]